MEELAEGFEVVLFVDVGVQKTSGLFRVVLTVA
jgi:hypothetical protein